LADFADRCQFLSPATRIRSAVGLSLDVESQAHVRKPARELYSIQNAQKQSTYSSDISPSLLERSMITDKPPSISETRDSIGRQRPKGVAAEVLPQMLLRSKSFLSKILAPRSLESIF
jgi:hypothetical protein